MNKEIEKRSFRAVWATLARNPRYWILFAVVAGLFYLFNALITNIRQIGYIFKNEGLSAAMHLLITMILTFHRSILLSSVVTLLIIAALLGVLVCLMTCSYQRNVRHIRSSPGFFGSMGLFLGFVAPGCIACGIGLVGALGITSALATLPFQGKEISFLAIILLLISIVRLSRKAAAPLACAPSRFHLHTNERRSTYHGT